MHSTRVARNVAASRPVDTRLNDSTAAAPIRSSRNQCVARHTGYEKIGSELPPSSHSGEYQPGEMQQRSLRRALNAFGYDEAINFSFIPQESRFDLIPPLAGHEDDQPQLANPIIEDAAWMRSTLLPGLLTSLRHNFNPGIRVVRFFEIGRIFSTIKAGELPDETLALA